MTLGEGRDLSCGEGGGGGGEGSGLSAFFFSKSQSKIKAFDYNKEINSEESTL